MLNLILITLFYGLATNATTISCTHPSLCQLATVATIRNGITINSPIQVTGDPHHFEPTPQMVKELLRSDIVISGPSELNHWWKKGQRKNEISLSLSKKLMSAYPDATSHALSHFWLYPEIECDLIIQLTTELKKQGITTRTPSCKTERLDEIGFAGKINLQNRLIILGHDAIAPLLNKLGTNTISLKASHDHEEIMPDRLKSLYRAVEANRTKSLIWILDKGTILPSSVTKLQKENDQIFIISIESRSKSETTSVRDLIKIFGEIQ